MISIMSNVLLMTMLPSCLTNYNLSWVFPQPIRNVMVVKAKRLTLQTKYSSLANPNANLIQCILSIENSFKNVPCMIQPNTISNYIWLVSVLVEARIVQVCWLNKWIIQWRDAMKRFILVHKANVNKSPARAENNFFPLNYWWRFRVTWILFPKIV